MSTNQLNELSGHAFRENSGKMAAYLCKIYGFKNIDSIGDIIQDTFETALLKWKYGAIPDNPSAWLMTVAKNKAVNYFKKAQRTDLVDSFINDHHSTSPIDEVILEGEIADSQLRLLLSCCHPGISEKNQIVLTLSILCGFGNQEIASALLMKGEAVKKALTRSKKYLREELPTLESTGSLKDENRVKVVQTVLYLMFNEGYKSTKSSELINHDLCYESIRLTKLLLKDDVPSKPETQALLAIMFYALARFPARISEEGKIITLAQQDRTLWNQTYMKEGFYYLKEATKTEEVGKYHIQAIISSIHCHTQYFDKTNWAQIIELYEQLELIDYSPLTELNKIVAISYYEGPAVGLNKLEVIKGSKKLEGHYLLYAVEGDMLARLGKPHLAKRAFNKAHDLSMNSIEKEFLEDRILEL